MKATKSYVLRLKDYSKLIHLDEQCVEDNQCQQNKSNDKCEYCNLLQRIIKEEVKCNHDHTCYLNYRGFINELPAMSITDEQLLSDIETMLITNKKITGDVETIKTLKEEGHSIAYGNKLCLWRGDITQLKVDAIVNAANNQMEGCFAANHSCIDNAIHTCAGPRLRDDCHKIMMEQGFLEPTGLAKITRGYCLPSKYVIHTVGPIVEHEKDGKLHLTNAECSLLQSCYTSCLDVADEMKTIKSIAFCCISTGVFGFPLYPASQIAMSSVIEWLYNHPFTNIEKVIFNVFSDKDEEVYKSTIKELDSELNESELRPQPNIYNLKVMSQPDSKELQQIEEVAKLFKSCSHIVIGAAAGFSIDNGFDFGSTSTFSSYGHSLIKHGITHMYDTIGFDEFDSEENRWCFEALVANYMRFSVFNEHQFDHYKLLLNLINKYNKKYFIKTTNVDGMFERSGYDKEKIFTVHGDYKYIQCCEPCSQEVYDFEPIAKKIMENMDPYEQMTLSELVPKCPRCGGEMMINIRQSRFFVEKPYMVKEKDYLEFVNDGIKNGTVLILEFGVGRSTQDYIRIPFEEYCKNKNVYLVRVNIDKELLVSEVEDGYYPFFRSGKHFLELLSNALSK